METIKFQKNKNYCIAQTANVGTVARRSSQWLSRRWYNGFLTVMQRLQNGRNMVVMIVIITVVQLSYNCEFFLKLPNGLELHI